MSMSKFATVADYYAHIEQVNAELLEALEFSEQVLCRQEDELRRLGGFDDKNSEIAILKARAAIAKARGVV